MPKNTVEIEGNLTKDAVFRGLPSGDSGVSFRIGHNNKYKTGKGEELTESFFFDIDTIVKKADVGAMQALLVKGAPVNAKGRLKTRTYGEGDAKRTVTEIHAFTIVKQVFGKSEGQPA